MTDEFELINKSSQILEMNSAALPLNVLRCMSEKDRLSLGKAGQLPEEIAAKQEAKNERELQSQIIALLRLRGIEPLWHRTDKKSAATVGWPDITFAVVSDVAGIVPVAWEVKFGDGTLSGEQKRIGERLRTEPNCWCVRTIRSIDEAREELQRMGIVKHAEAPALR